MPRTQVILPFFIDMDGIFIPREILEVEDLSSTEKMVLSLYKYYTENGKYKCCSLTKPQVAEELCISPGYMKKIKRHLTELGYIRTSGIKVFYVGVKGVTIGTTEGHQSTQGGNYSDPQRDTIVPTKGSPEYPHKKEKEEKKELKKEKKGVTNFDLLLEHLPSDYKTPERIKYIEDKYIDRINEADFNVGGIVDIWITHIKEELNKTFPINYVIPKQEKKVDFIDLF